MIDLFVEDTHHLNAAKSWIELGNHVEAYNELEKIALVNRSVPEVLELRWQVYTSAGDHNAALSVARELLRVAPERYAGWIWRARSLYELGRIEQAIECLLLTATEFPKLGIIPFHIACYYAALNKLAEAKAWLICAFSSPEADTSELKALSDPKVQELWEEIGSFSG